MFHKILLTTAAIAASTVTVSAETIRWARAGDAITMDPHAQNEGPTHGMNHQIYDSLLQRDMSGNIIPSLALSWAALADNPNVWRFNLRQGVSYHDGAAFDSEDVVFSLNRAMADGSEMKELLSSIKDIRAVDAHTVDIETNGANPLLVNNLTNMFMMDKDWSTANDVLTPHDVAKGETNFATMNTNGTGAFMLVSRSVDEKTVLTSNPNYWGKDIYPNQVTDIIYTPIQSAATRVAALLSGEVDIIQDVPVQDLGRVSGTDGLNVATAAQNRVIFFGLDTVEGPTSNLKVRQAMNIAINRDAIKKIVMREQSDPTGVIMPPFVNGWTAALNQYPALVAVIAAPLSDYHEPALVMAATLRYNREAFDAALNHYQQLEQVAVLKRHVLEARIGIMRCSRALGDGETVLAYVGPILEDSGTPEDIRTAAHYNRALILMDNNSPEAKADLQVLALHNLH